MPRLDISWHDWLMRDARWQFAQREAPALGVDPRAVYRDLIRDERGRATRHINRATDGTLSRMNRPGNGTVDTPGPTRTMKDAPDPGDA